MSDYPDYPVGKCMDERCFYPEPHRHGLECDEACACKGIGAETSPITEYDVQSCDWGGCNRWAVALRRNGNTDLPVCSWHAGWDDEEKRP